MNDKNLGHGITVENSSSIARSSAKTGSGTGNVNVLLIPLQTLIKILESIFNLLKGKVSVSFPENFFPPVGSETVDFRALESVNANSEIVLFSFKCPVGMTFRFSKYALFTDILLSEDIEFIPSIDDNRILKYHGDPQSNFKMNLAIGPDLSENCCIPCDFELSSGQTLKILVVNSSSVPSPIGARFFGYKINQNSVSRQFGG